VSTTLKARMVRLENRYPELKPGPERMTNEELEGVIGVLRQLEAGEAVDRDCQEFRVRAAIVDPMEVPDGTTQSSPYP